MNQGIEEALTALIFTGIIGGIVKVYLDYKAKLMENIWGKRVDAYMKFVQATALFPKYPRSQVCWKQVFKLSKNFRDWYFEGHGLLLSTRIRNLYFDLQEHIVELTRGRTHSEQELNEEEYNDLRERCSALRSLMARELESRESPLWYRFRKETKA